ncbi:hypothetical protein [Niallia sp. 01092]|uniref:hypothetical protein n=1 Tax=unclassified Niallia TaxID=2837522 RepID=UPI003FD5A9F3
MYRFSMEKENWILRFLPNIVLEEERKHVIVKSILLMGKDLATFSHGNSCVILNKEMGLIVFYVEKIPSSILTVSTIIEKENWYMQLENNVIRYNF